MSNAHNLPAERATTAVGFTDRMPGERITAFPPTQTGGLITWMMLGGVGLFSALIAWTAIAEIQSAVVGQGAFQVEGDLRSVQHLEGGIVRDIRVKEGELVEQGQLLAVLDDTRANAQNGILANELVAAMAREARLIAETRNAPTMELSDEIKAVIGDNPTFRLLVDAQVALFQTNKSLDESQVAILQERIVQITEQMRGIEQQRELIQRQLELLRGELADMQALFDQKLITKTRMTDRLQEENRILAELRDNETEMQDARAQISETRERIVLVRRDRQTEIAGEMQAVREQIYDLRQRLTAARDIKDRLSVRAPVAGRVIDLALNTPGAVIPPGFTLMQIVPQDLPIVVTARIRPSDIDDVQEGGEARVRPLSYSYRSTLPLEGQVTHVSADTFTDDQTREAYYEVKITMLPEEIARMPDAKALPGMPVQVMLTTKSQTIMTYLLDPVLGSLETALIETD